MAVVAKLKDWEIERENWSSGLVKEKSSKDKVNRKWDRGDVRVIGIKTKKKMPEEKGSKKHGRGERWRE